MPWDPMAELQAWHQALAGPRLEPWAPAIDVYETADFFIVTAEVPGLTRDQIELAVEDHRLTIKGRRAAAPSGQAGVRYHQVERGRGPFARTFEFADRIDTGRVTAELASGVLTVQLPKTARTPARRIDVG